MPLFAVAFNSGSVASGSIVNGVETSVKVFCDDRTYSLETKANVVSQALEGTPCKLGENDLVTPSDDTHLDGAPVSIFVTRATPVTVVDGGNKIMTRSAYKNASDILKQLNINVFPEDAVASELIMSDFDEDGLGQRITITRSPAVTLEVDGGATEVRTSKNTVEELLVEKGVALGPKDEVVPALSTAITRGMKITVARVSEADITEDEVMPFQTITKNDYNMFQGQSKVEADGANGLKRVVSRVVSKNGVVVSKTVLSEQIVKTQGNKVVVVGVKPYTHQDLWNIMVEAGQKYGVDPSKMYRVMMCESGGNVYSNGRYKGLFQWDSSFYKWAAIAGVPADYFNPRSQIFATAARVQATGWGAWPVCGYR